MTAVLEYFNLELQDFEKHEGEDLLLYNLSSTTKKVW